MIDEKRMRASLERALRDLFLNNKNRSLPEIAAWLNKPESTIRKEIDPHAAGAKMGAFDVAEATYYTRDWVYLNAFAAECHAVVYPMPSAEIDRATIHHKLASMAKEFGELVAQVAKSIADDDVSANELTRCHREAAELIAAVQATLEHLGRMHQEHISTLERRLERARAAGMKS